MGLVILMEILFILEILPKTASVLGDSNSHLLVVLGSPLLVEQVLVGVDSLLELHRGAYWVRC